MTIPQTVSGQDALQFLNELASMFLEKGKFEAAAFLTEELIPTVLEYDC